MMKTVAFVPVKLSSERLPGKNIKKFSDGTPLITCFLKTLTKVEQIDELYVFCSSEEIQEYILPGVIFLKRPKYLDLNDATPQDIIESFMSIVEADIYMVCHCTSPFVAEHHFEECISKVKEGYDSAFTAQKVQRLMWYNGNPLNFDAEEVPRTQDLPVYYNEVSAAYVFKKEVFTKLRRRIGVNPYICEVSGYETIDIDYPEDFEIADAVYMNLIRAGR